MKVLNRRLSGDSSAQARGHGEHSGAVTPKSFLCPPNFVVLKKICFKRIIKIKIFPLKKYILPPKSQNLATGLVLPNLCLQLECFVLKSIRPRDVALGLHNIFYKPPLGGPLEAFWGGRVGLIRH